MRVIPRPVIFVMGNAKKLEKVREILGQSIPFQSLKLDLPELQGKPEEISKEKARLAAVQVGIIYSRLMKTSYAMCIFSLTLGPEEPTTFVGKTPGKIVPARGPNDFGWDPVFQPEGYEQTYAE